MGQTPQAARSWQGVPYVAQPLGDPLAGREQWESKDFCVYETALCPAALLRAKSDRVVFFEGLREYGAEPPSFFVTKTAGGVRAVSRGEAIAGGEMAAPWIVASFAGCKGFEQFDAPWYITLQRRPRRVALSDEGLEITFAAEDTGYIAEMPLFGYYKPPQPGADLAREHGLPSRNIYPWTWRKSFPRELVQHCDWWARVLRAFPVAMQESFSVNPAQDTITFRQDYRWLLWRDDWGTPSTKFAVLPPTLGLAWRTPGFPMEISAPIYDPDYPTAFGPFVGALGVDRLEINMRVLQYLNELEELELPAQPGSIAAEALSRLVRAMEQKFPEAWRFRYDHGSRKNFCWNIVADVWYCRALPLVPEELRRRACSSLRIYFEHDVLRPYTPHRGKYILHGPGIGSWGSWGDAGKFSSNALQAIWAYGQYTGDWELLRERWPLIKRYFITPEEIEWIGVGRFAIAEMGDEAPPASAYARMAWQLGDLDEYLFGCYVFAKELVVHYVKQVGGRYFYELQPYHFYEPMPPNICPTNMWGDTAGWQVDSLTWGHGERQATNRWVRFHDPDVGRFYRDHLKALVNEELERPEYRAHFAKHVARDDAHILPSYVRLRSFLLDEPAEKLVQIAPVGKMSGPGAGIIAAMYSYLRGAVPRRYVRLVSESLGASPFVLGLERDGRLSNTTTVQALRGDLAIEPTWHRWKMPRGLDRRSFGKIDPFPGKVPGLAGAVRLSYVSRVRWAEALPPRSLPNAQEILARQGQGEVYVIGPFPNENDLEITEKAYPPEREIRLDATYQGSFGPVRWKKVALRNHTVDLQQALLAPGQSPFMQLGYGLRYVFSPDERAAWLFVGCHGGAQAWVNGELVLSEHNSHRGGFAPDRLRAPIRLRRGWNAILVKVECPGRVFKLQFRVAHPDRGPMPDIRYAAQPPR